MRREIAAVVFFLKRLVKNGEKLESHKIELFVERLAVALQEKFRGHWYPENPSKGQAYRCGSAFLCSPPGISRDALGSLLSGTVNLPQHDIQHSLLNIAFN